MLSHELPAVKKNMHGEEEKKEKEVVRSLSEKA